MREGARVVVGGAGMPDGVDRGWYVRPTVFTGVDNNMKIAREEIFGPVLSVIGYQDEAEALRIANDSEYGLAGTVWTRDIDRGMDVARRIRTGSVGVNQYMPDFAAPGWVQGQWARARGRSRGNRPVRRAAIAPPGRPSLVRKDRCDLPSNPVGDRQRRHARAADNRRTSRFRAGRRPGVQPREGRRRCRRTPGFATDRRAGHR